MGNEVPPLYIWEELPNPRSPDAPNGDRTCVSLFMENWRKIVGKHFHDRSEPWRELLGEDVLQSVTASPYGPYDREPLKQAITAAGTIIGRELRDGLSRPLVMTHETMEPIPAPKPNGPRYRSVVKWMIILPSGALAVVSEGKKRGNVLRTCHFSGTASVETDSESRWNHAACAAVRKYAKKDSESGKYFLPPWLHGVEENGELRFGICFVTPRQWGWKDDSPDVPWSEDLPPWPRVAVTQRPGPFKAIRERVTRKELHQ